MAKTTKTHGFREDQAKFGKRNGSPSGWIDIVRQNMKPGQVNPYIALIAAKDHMSTFLSDVWGEGRSQLQSRDRDSQNSNKQSSLFLNNTTALVEVFCKNYIPSHACNIAIAVTEKVFGSLDPIDVKRGLGTTGEVTDVKALVNLSTKYKVQIEAVKAREDALAKTPILINDEDMMIIHEDASFSDPVSRYHMTYCMIRPEVVQRLKYRFKDNKTSIITEAMDQILTFNDLQDKLGLIFSDKSKIRANYTTASKVAAFSDEVGDAMAEKSYKTVEADASPVSKEDYYYIANPAIIYQLIDYRQQNEESHVRIDFIPLSVFNTLKGEDTASYLSEVYTDSNEGAISQEEIDEAAKEASADDKHINLVNLLIDKRICVDDVKYASIVSANKTFNTTDLIYIDEKGHSARALDIIVKTRTDGRFDDKTEDVTGVDMSPDTFGEVHDYHISSMDPMYFKDAGYKNSGFYSTCDISVAEAHKQMKAYISSIFSATNSSSQVLSFLSKLIDISNVRNGYTTDIQAADYYGMVSHFEDSMKLDTMRIANNKNHFVLEPTAKISKRKRLVATKDIDTTDNSITTFNSDFKVNLQSFSTIKTVEEFVEATRLVNGIGYVNMNPSNQMTNATILDKVLLPIDNTPIVVSKTPNKVVFELEAKTSDNTKIVKDYFMGNTYSDDNSGNLNVEYKDLVVGLDIYKKLTGTDTIKHMIKSDVIKLRNSYTDFEVMEIVEDTYTGMDQVLRVGKMTRIHSIVPTGYKKTRQTTGLDMLCRVWKETIMARRIIVETSNINVSRNIINEPSDIYGVLEHLKNNVQFDIDDSSFSGLLSTEEQKTLINMKIIGNYIMVSDNFKTIFTEIAVAIKANLNNEYNDMFDVIDQLRDVTNAISTFQMSLRESVIEAIKPYTLIERLFILEELFSDDN